MTPAELQVRAISGVPRVRSGDDLGALLLNAIGRSGEMLCDGDVVVVAQKIVSKAEGRIVRLADVVPSQQAIELGARVEKDPRAVEAILGEAVTVLRAVPGVLIVETRQGLILANAGADMSNIEHDERTTTCSSSPRIRTPPPTAFAPHSKPAAVGRGSGSSWRTASGGRGARARWGSRSG